MGVLSSCYKRGPEEKERNKKQDQRKGENETED